MFICLQRQPNEIFLSSHFCGTIRFPIMFLSGASGLGMDRLVNSVDGEFELTKEEKFRQEVARRQAEEEVRFRDATGLRKRREVEKLQQQEQLKKTRRESTALKKRLLVASAIALVASLAMLFLFRHQILMM